MTDAVKDFKEFVLKGDVVALAVAVVVATAFGAVVAAFVANLVTPLIAAIGGRPDFGELEFTINGSRFRYGLVVNALITFLIVAAVVFFLVVRPYNSLRSRFAKEGDPDVPSPQYAVETGSTEALAQALTARAGEGWTVVSVSDGGQGILSAVLVKGG